ncbi:MAG: ABC transporter permease subunit [Candidatus Magnetobacterium sp. LHC-1]|uniref:ABC transporter permease n=1 Tax=Candidatus Magnetobacterium casense TaxID=1455061 RepID=A0ABS6RUM4_9BACT|nr:ABC transporter permease subunit [Candidatus Magnetobacterium casensis]MBF0609186.1 ABC transporter permease [Nitrospirota bacterium]MBV6340045.1 ABC transporter permease [Candidatus Magnetobacterium casensis]
MVFTDAMRAIAHKEVSDKLKSKWVGVITVGFALFTLIIAYFGTATTGIASFRNMEATIASLTSLVIYFIPLLALTLGGGVIADERDRHTLEFYLASPISVTEFLTGKFIGLAIALTLPAVLGFGLCGVVLVAKTGIGSLGSYLAFMLNSVILGLMFLSISFLVSVVFYERSKVIAFTIFLWLFFTILYDMGLIGVLIVTKGVLSPKIFSALLMLNPVDVYRILNFVTIGKYMIFLGMSSVDLPKFINAPVLWVVCLLWVCIPLLLSYRFFKKRYLT